MNTGMIKAFFTRQFGSFLLIGGFAMIVNMASRVLYEKAVGFSAAVILAYLTGMLVAFILMWRYVFPQSTQPLKQAVIRFTVINILGIAQTWVITMLFFRYILPALSISWHAEDISHMIGVASPVFVSFLGHKFWTFKTDKG